jgi:uncharacterized protein YqhQ
MNERAGRSLRLHGIVLVAAAVLLPLLLDDSALWVLVALLLVPLVATTVYETHLANRMLREKIERRAGLRG